MGVEKSKREHAMCFKKTKQGSRLEMPQCSRCWHISGDHARIKGKRCIRASGFANHQKLVWVQKRKANVLQRRVEGSAKQEEIAIEQVA